MLLLILEQPLAPKELIRSSKEVEKQKYLLTLIQKEPNQPKWPAADFGQC
jgi:hypothetical protein